MYSIEYSPSSFTLLAPGTFSFLPRIKKRALQFGGRGEKRKEKKKKIKMGFFPSLSLSVPFFLRFVEPALKQKRRKSVLVAAPAKKRKESIREHKEQRRWMKQVNCLSA